MIEGSAAPSHHQLQLLISDPLRPIDWLWSVSSWLLSSARGQTCYRSHSRRTDESGRPCGSENMGLTQS